MKKLTFALILGLGISLNTFKAYALTSDIKNKTLAVLAGSPFYATAAIITYYIIKAKLEKPKSYPETSFLKLESLRNLENIFVLPAGLIAILGCLISHSTYDTLSRNITS